jgi:histidine triad (HIT) family protein
MATIFTRIIQGEIPCYKIAETEQFLSFLDIRPVAKGHTLCIPKVEVDYIFDVEDELLAGLMLFAKKVAKAVEKEVPCLRCGVAVIGLEVPHAHIHLIPMNSMADFNLRNKVDMSHEELSALAANIAAHL